MFSISYYPHKIEEFKKIFLASGTNTFQSKKVPWNVGPISIGTFSKKSLTVYEVYGYRSIIEYNHDTNNMIITIKHLEMLICFHINIHEECENDLYNTTHLNSGDTFTVFLFVLLTI